MSNDARVAPRDAAELATLPLTGGPRASRRPAPRTGSPLARGGGTTPTDDASLGAAALIAKGEAAMRLGRYEHANEAFAAARAVTAAEKERGSPPQERGIDGDGDDTAVAKASRQAAELELAMEAKAAERDALEAKAAEREAASETATGEAEAQRREVREVDDAARAADFESRVRVEDATIADFESRVRVKDATIADLRTELRLAGEASEALRRRAEDAGGKLRVAESEIAAAAAARSSLEIENADLNARLETLRAETDTLRAEMERLRAETAATIDSHARRARDASVAETVAREALAAEVEKCRRKIDEAVDGRARAEIASAAAEKLAADATRRAANVDAVVARMREECEVLVAEREAECEVRMRRAATDLDRASAEVATLTANAEEALVTLRESEAARAEAVADAEDARGRLANVEAALEAATRREEEANIRAEAAELAASEIAAAARAAKEAAASEARASGEREAEVRAELSALRGSVDAARTKATEAVARATRDLGKRRELFTRAGRAESFKGDAFQKSLESIREGTTSANACAKAVCDALEVALDGGYGRARVCVAESRGCGDDPGGDAPPPVVLAAGAEASAFVAPNDRLPASSLAHLCVLAARADACPNTTGRPDISGGGRRDDPGPEEVRFVRGVTALRGCGNADDETRDWNAPETTTGNRRTDEPPPFAATASGAGVAIALRGTSNVTSSVSSVAVLCVDFRAMDSPMSVADVAAAHEAAASLGAIYAADADRVRVWTRRVIRARWSELDDGDEEDAMGGAGDPNTGRRDYRFDTPAGAARVLFERAAHKRTLESLFRESNDDPMRHLTSLGAPDGARALPRGLAAPLALSAWAACACVVSPAAVQPPPFTRADAAAFTAFADAATATDAILAERRREDARVAGLASLGIETNRETGVTTGTSSVGATPGGAAFTKATLRATGEAAARRASVLWAEGGVRACVAALTGPEAETDGANAPPRDSPMTATKISADLAADRDLRDAVRALLAAAPMLRPALDGDREWREMGGFDYCGRGATRGLQIEIDGCARLWAWAATNACAWRAWRRVRTMRMDEGAVLSILDGMERAHAAAAVTSEVTSEVRSEGDDGGIVIGDGRDDREAD